jgi:amidase
VCLACSRLSNVVSVAVARRFIQAEATNGFDAEYFAALTADHDLGSTQGIDFVLKNFNLDALVLPAPGFTTSPAGI